MPGFGSIARIFTVMATIGALAFAAAHLLPRDASPPHTGHAVPAAARGESCTHDAHAVHAAGGVAHPADAVKAEEHSAYLRLTPACEATHVAVNSGDWSRPDTWVSGNIPGPGARVHVPTGVILRVGGNVAAGTLEWVRVDGRLTFATDRATVLVVRTLVIGEGGALEIGRSDDRVQANVRTRLLFAPRTGRDRTADPLDLGGGLISHGKVVMAGAVKTPFRPAVAPRRGDREIRFAQPVAGWRTGDVVLIPGTEFGIDQDETRTVTLVAADGRRVVLDRPLMFDRTDPYVTGIPVANLTRNVEIASLDTRSLQGRAHVMIMHAQTGTMIDGVAFRGLGRTDARVAHTEPMTGPGGITLAGSDENTIGRYALHFHVRSGADIRIPPHVVRASVIVDSPKHGLVNHGGHVLAEDNVSFRIAGSHFLAENGSEIGAFRRNLAVRSTGSGDTILSREAISDFGHTGHGFWLQSAAVEVTDNWAFGHAEGGIVVLGYAFTERGRSVLFDTRNVGGMPHAHADGLGQVPIANVSFHHSGNVVAASKAGIEVWNHKIYAQHHEVSLIERTTVWNVTFAVFLPYARNVVLRDLRLHGSSYSPGGYGIAGNTMTESLQIERLSASGFYCAVSLPQRGRNLLRDASFSGNSTDVEIASANVPGRRIRLENVAFDPDSRTQHVALHMRDLVLPENGDVAMLFAEDRIDLASRDERNLRLYFPSQHPDFVPFPEGGPSMVLGMTGHKIKKTFGIAIGGALAPADARVFPKSTALAAPAALETFVAPAAPAVLTERTGVAETYPMATLHFKRASAAISGERWNMASIPSNGQRHLIYADRNPPKFLLMRGLLPLRIHPNDVAYGYRVMGMVVDKVDDRMTWRAFTQDFRNLRIDHDGFVQIAFQVADMAGNETPVRLTLKVTPEATRRGANLDFFIQRKYCGACGYDTLQEDVRRLYENDRMVDLG